jgi:hypothetical protein
MDALREIDLRKVLPSDDEAAEQSKLLHYVTLDLKLRKIEDELRLLCSSPALPVAIRDAFNAYFGNSQSAFKPNVNNDDRGKMQHDAFVAYDELLRAAHNELHVRLDRDYRIYPRGMIIRKPGQKLPWQRGRKVGR